MARLNFIKASITGRIGELVGSNWKGVPYIKTYTPPTNPRTQIQQETRYTFGFLGSMASAFSGTLLNGHMFPSPRKMSPMNRCVQINKRFVTDRTVNLRSLQIYPATIEPDIIATPFIDDVDTYIKNTHITMKLYNIDRYRRRPDAYAFGIYCCQTEIWYGVGVFPIPETPIIPDVVLSIPIFMLDPSEQFNVYSAPVWLPQPEIKLRGGNGQTYCDSGYGLSEWNPLMSMSASKKLALLNNILDERRLPQTEEQIKVLAEKEKKFEAWLAKNPDVVICESTGGLDREIARLKKAEKRLQEQIEADSEIKPASNAKKRPRPSKKEEKPAETIKAGLEAADGAEHLNDGIEADEVI